VGDAGRDRVRLLMCDGEWHGGQEVCGAAGTPERPAPEGLRRLRELRDEGFNIVKRRVPGTSDFEYRMTDPPRPRDNCQGDLGL